MNNINQSNIHWSTNPPARYFDSGAFCHYRVAMGHEKSPVPGQIL